MQDDRFLYSNLYLCYHYIEICPDNSRVKWHKRAAGLHSLMGSAKVTESHKHTLLLIDAMPGELVRMYDTL